MRDWIIQNGYIVNGKKEPPFAGALLIKSGKIEAVSKVPDCDFKAEGIPVIDAKGAYVTPGFIDIHRHGDWKALLGADGGDDELLNRQGLTTVVNGNCGLSVMPAEGQYGEEIRHFLEPVTGSKPAAAVAEEADRDLGTYYKALAQTKRTVNTGMLAGNGTIRACAAGYRDGSLSAEEISRIHRLLEGALADGALGVSLGLGYAPEFAYNADSLTEALEPLRGTDIPITTHIRSEGDGSYESVEEVIRVAQSLGIPLHISHMKCIGKRNWHVGPEKTLALLHRKNEEGMRVDFDLYPYKTGSTQLFHVIPPAFQSGGTVQFLKRIRDRSFRDALTKALKTPSHEFENIVELVGFSNIMAASLHTDTYRRFAGLSIEAIAESLGTDPYETLYDILEAEHCEVTMLDTIACDEDICRFYKDPLSSVISDAIYPDDGRLHPRVYAAFPEFLIRYVREKKLLPIEEAIYKMTAGPADVLKIDRGVIEEGRAADLCIFRLEDLAAPATFSNPEQMCTGFRYVLVGGQAVVKNDVWQREAAGAGQILRRA